MKIKNIIGNILLILISIGFLFLCFFAFYDSGYSIIGSLALTGLTCAISLFIVALVFFLIWVFD